jgi:hypothetical protein
MPTRIVPLSPKLALDELESELEELVVAVDGPQAVRNVAPPREMAVRPEALRKLRRVNAWLSDMTDPPVVDISLLYTQPEGTHSPPPCN